jgi:hypothetical protein
MKPAKLTCFGSLVMMAIKVVMSLTELMMMMMTKYYRSQFISGVTT